MKKFKDFLYDKNDILIALLILAVAALLIIWRFDAIMEYPKTLITSDAPQEESDAPQSETPKEDPSDKDDPKKDEPSDKDPAKQPLWSGGVLTKEVTLEVRGDTATEAIQCLIDAGLFKDYAEYQSTCTAAGLDHEKVSGGSITFEKGFSKADIADAVNWS